MTRTFCDRCGDEIVDWRQTFELLLNRKSNPDDEFHMAHVCEPCANYIMSILQPDHKEVAF